MLLIISDIESTKCSYNSVWVPFKAGGLRICHPILKKSRHGRAITNPWVDQCTVCSALKLDTQYLSDFNF